jgi:hypothetical protein
MTVDPRLLTRTLLLSLAFLLIGGLLRPEHAEAACTAGPTTYTTAQAATTYVVPTDCTTLTIKAWGGGGGGGETKAGTGGTGGGGGFAKGDVTVTPGENLTIQIGGGGLGGTTAAGTGDGGGGNSVTAAGGGTGGNQGDTAVGGGGGGGGFATVKRGATFLIQAGGGGGGGGAGENAGNNGGAGGAGGGSTGIAGGAGAATGGGGGTASAGGTGGGTGGTSGSANQGGNGGTSTGDARGGGGGGGGGRFGGGGGGANGSQGAGAGGGGGSSLITGTCVGPPCEVQGSGSAAANTGDANYASPAGVGGGAGANGNPGRIVLIPSGPACSPCTNLGNGTNPGNVTIAPDAAATQVNAFTLHTDTGTDTVTALTVNLAPAGVSAGISLVEVTSDNGATVYGSSSSWTGDNVPLTVSIPVTTTATQFRVRITPKSHAAMPAPDGAAYAVTATINSTFTCTNGSAGSDTASATVTIDNDSPNEVTGESATAGDTQVRLGWTNPTGDFSNVVILRNTASITDVPVEGSTPTVGDQISPGNSIVRYIASGTTFIDAGLTNGTLYYYRIFAKDTSGNYADLGKQVSATANAAAAPNFQVAGTAYTGTGALTAVAWPAHQANDIGLLIIEQANTPVSPVLGANSANWTMVTDSPQGTGGTGTGSTQLTVFWSRATSSTMGNVGVNDAGDHQRAQILTFRGVATSGDPWDGTPDGDVATATTAVTIPGGTTTVANTLVVAIVAAGIDVNSTVQTSGWTNAALTSLTERADTYTTTGHGGGFSVATGVKAAAGVYGPTTATLATGGAAAVQGRLSLALRPVVVCGSDPDVSHVSASTRTFGGAPYSVTLSFPSAPVIILRKGSAFTEATEPSGDLPADGKSYTTAVGGATVISNSASAMTSYTDSGLAAGTYYYRVVAKSAGPCYAPGAAAQTGLSMRAGQAGIAWSHGRSLGSIMKPGIAGVGKIYPSFGGGAIVSLDTTDANANEGRETWAPVTSTSPPASQSFQGWMTWVPGRGAAWYNPAWSSRKPITIDRTKVGAGGVTNFPVLISRTTDTDLQSKAQADGDDILFTSADGTTKLSHEIEKYVSGTGELVAWVKVPSVSASADTVLYMYYGNDGATSQQDATNVWDSNFKGVWHLKEGTGVPNADSTSNANTGTPNGPTTTTGKISGALDFDGVNDTVAVANEANFDFERTSPFSFGVWLKPDIADTSIQVPIAKITDVSPWTGWELSTNLGNLAGDPGKLAIDLIATWTSPAIRVYTTSDTNLNDGQWHHYVVTYDGSSAASGIKLYEDGVSLALTPTIHNNLSSGSILNDAPVTLGARSSATDYWYNGILDELRVSNTALTAAWITTEYNNQSSPATFYSVGPESSGEVVFAADQGGKVYAVDGATGAELWAEHTTGATAIQAGVAVQLAAYSDAAFQTQYGATTDIVLAASKNGGTNNQLYAIKATDGTLAWSFNGTLEPGTAVSDITGMPYVDYSRNRIYVATRAPGGVRSLWVINSLNGSSIPCSGTDCNLGDLNASPTVSYDGTTLYVGNVGSPDGNLYALNASTLALKWTFPLGAGNGSLQGFVWEDYSTPGRLYFTTTTGKVMCVQDNGASATACWTPTTVPGTLSCSPVACLSTPLLLNRLFVGGDDGRVHQIRPTDGVAEDNLDIAVTPLKTVGDVSTETGDEIFVSTEDGKIYMITLTGSSPNKVLP